VDTVEATELTARLRAAGCVRAEDEARLLLQVALPPDAREHLVRRRLQGEPLEHVLGWAEFHGLRVRTTPGVFVPRWRSEFLVDQALAWLDGRSTAPGRTLPTRRSQNWAIRNWAIRRRPVGGPGPIVLDLCCGTGALALAVATARPDARIHAVDLDPAAVRCARDNLAEVGGHAYLGDLFDPLPENLRGRTDLILANAPYVPTRELALLPREARLHEAPLALDGGPDGLEVVRRILAQVSDWLAPHGTLLIETSRDQAPYVAADLADRGLRTRISHDPEAEATVTEGTHA